MIILKPKLSSLTKCDSIIFVDFDNSKIRSIKRKKNVFFSALQRENTENVKSDINCLQLYIQIDIKCETLSQTNKIFACSCTNRWFICREFIFIVPNLMSNNLFTLSLSATLSTRCEIIDVKQIDFVASILPFLFSLHYFVFASISVSHILSGHPHNGWQYTLTNCKF